MYCIYIKRIEFYNKKNVQENLKKGNYRISVWKCWLQNDIIYWKAVIGWMKSLMCWQSLKSSNGIAEDEWRNQILEATARKRKRKEKVIKNKVVDGVRKTLHKWHTKLCVSVCKKILMSHSTFFFGWFSKEWIYCTSYPHIPSLPVLSW